MMVITELVGGPSAGKHVTCIVGTVTVCVPQPMKPAAMYLINPRNPGIAIYQPGREVGE